MKKITNRLDYKSLLSFTILAILFLCNCATIETEETVAPKKIYIDKAVKINNRYSELSKLNSILIDGHVNITHPHKNANLFADFKYHTLDSLEIQFKDLIGRKIALLNLDQEQYHLWLQRQDRHLKGKELPENYSYLTLDNKLTTSELRKIILAIPISQNSQKSRDDSTGNMIKYSSVNNLSAFYEVDKNHNYIKKISFYDKQNLLGKVLYKEYKLSGNILLPSQIIIENIQNPIKIEIKLSHFKFDRLKTS